jgi:hypothetical protein
MLPAVGLGTELCRKLLAIGGSQQDRAHEHGRKHRPGDDIDRSSQDFAPAFGNPTLNQFLTHGRKSPEVHWTTRLRAAVRPYTSSWYISFAKVGGTMKRPRVVARAK